jgi:hypothetical protein
MRTRGIRLGFASLRTEVRALLERSEVQAALGDGALFTSLKSSNQPWMLASPAGLQKRTGIYLPPVTQL